MKGLLLMITILLCNEQCFSSEGPFQHFTPSDSGYTLIANYHTSLQPDSVMSILFDIDHIKRYNPDMQKLAFSEIKEHTYLMEVELQLPFYRAISLFRRSRKANSIIVTMKSFSHNRSIVPKLVSSYTHYTIGNKDGVTRIELQQNVQFDGKVNRIYMKMIQIGIKRFSETFAGYLSDIEKM